jgi:hypothetical protein
MRRSSVRAAARWRRARRQVFGERHAIDEEELLALGAEGDLSAKQR